MTDRLVHDGEPGSQPYITDTEIGFNGSGDDMYEGFAYPGSFTGPPDHEPLRMYCKTGRRPYGMVVAAVLLAIKHHLGDDVEIRSDGNLRDDEWEPATGLFAGVFPHRSFTADSSRVDRLRFSPA